MDTKKKEPIGLLFRSGTFYSQEAIHAYDHDKDDETGRQVDPHFKQNIPIHFDDTLSKWNYRAVPNA